jgi:uncharacterized protein (TIGR00297 family)
LNALLLIVVFFLSGNIVTKIGQKTKKKLKIVEYSRSWRNVVSNGLFPLVFCAMGGEKAFVYSVAAVTADKFASELGVLFGAPISLDRFERVIEGTSGAVSMAGTLFSVVGAFILAVSANAIGYKTDVFFTTLVGVIGCFADSVVGVLEERGVGTKETSNMICSIVGGLFGLKKI